MITTSHFTRGLSTNEPGIVVNMVFWPYIYTWITIFNGILSILDAKLFTFISGFPRSSQKDKLLIQCDKRVLRMHLCSRHLRRIQQKRVKANPRSSESANNVGIWFKIAYLFQKNNKHLKVHKHIDIRHVLKDFKIRLNRFKQDFRSANPNSLFLYP